MDIPLLAVVLAAVAAFALSGAWYSVWGDRLAALHPAYAPGRARPAGGTAVVELVRNLVVASVVAVLVVRLDPSSVGSSSGLGLLLWLGFPAPILAGSVWHERVPAALAAIHAGDWLFKLLAVAALVGWLAE